MKFSECNRNQHRWKYPIDIVVNSAIKEAELAGENRHLFGYLEALGQKMSVFLQWRH